jgi:hypothetical protein
VNRNDVRFRLLIILIPGIIISSPNSPYPPVIGNTFNSVSLTINESPELELGPDQNDQLTPGAIKNFQLFVLLKTDSGAIVELRLPDSHSNWRCQLNDSAGTAPLTDTDGDGTLDLGFVFPGKNTYFTIQVQAPTELTGDTAHLTAFSTLITAFLDTDTLIRDTARLNIKLLPGISIHNFPNPVTNQTIFVIGLPADGKISLAVFNRAGERISTLLQHEPVAAGVQFYTWNCCNDRNQPVVPGTYYYLLEYWYRNQVQRIKKVLVVQGQ